MLARFVEAALVGTLIALVPAPAGGDDGQPVKVVVRTDDAGENLLQADAWRPFEAGFERREGSFVCDNGEEASARRGAVQSILLDQQRPEPIVASAWSKAEGVTGSPDADYAVYLDLVYQDGTPLWGQAAAFDVGTGDWQERQVVVIPEKPVQRVSMYLLFRGRGGRALFRDPTLRVVSTPEGAYLFDGVPVVPARPAAEGFQVRDVAAGSDFVDIKRAALGLSLETSRREAEGATFYEATLTETTGEDRAVTLLYTWPVPPEGLTWHHDPRQSVAVKSDQEYINATPTRAVGAGRLSRYPLAAVSDGSRGMAAGLDMARPAFFRTGYHAASGELFLAFDLALTPEQPAVTVRFCTYHFEPKWGFRSALARYYELFPNAFRVRVPEQGLWMPFARISEVRDWEDFGFRFKEGTNETEWDNAHGILTFRYTEPMTWWMPMPAEMPRTMEAARAEAQRRAAAGDRAAQALMTSGFHDAAGQLPARLLDTPWCNGAVWSVNSMPGVEGEVTDFENQFGPAVRERYYGPRRRGDLAGEYVDSSEGYVTDELNFRRDHFAAAATPLVFCSQSHRPAIFRGLVAFEYIRAMAAEVHGMDKLMMANSTPSRICWLAPLLDVLGTETDWNPGGQWRPMADAELLYRRALSAGKPFCFLMNTRFEEFPFERVEKYMARSLAYGMFPGFFSHNASEDHYFSRPELYDRDRPLFRKYVPLCKRVAEAGWEPITLARTDDEAVYVERFGDRYLTVFNDSPQRKRVTVALEGLTPSAPHSPELVGEGIAVWQEGRATLELDAEGVALIDLAAGTEPR